ncbi:MAG: winged helix-turn-helix domain-containing protein [Gammaproteobacteria bacterium]|nr:winged helix-turn-helix domain-containing protein [Gammaproteobacteria bacterium]
MLLVPSPLAKRLLQSHTAFNQIVLHKLANTLRKSNEKIRMLSAKSMGRVIYFLSAQGNPNLHGEVHGKMLTHEEIANMVNLSRETVSRTITQLQKLGHLRIYYQAEQKMFCIKPIGIEENNIGFKA